ncbi:ABC transporter substrate-binding protein [Pedobacter montanisoli]|uniref:Helical backbone metal receptor n=1 Tax=Pedobacter montanisoli TaxID=2923277 RepID=A0ABS9ZXA2_9SPHI|nr:helical backbone metal receptor [Pedobacter montanisoli]MCJ0742920.1 helical backbone metal receptor [Pedobacter montanisoli]
MQKSFTDQLGHAININYPPKRIVSLVPSQTELLFDLGLNDEVVGITKFCIHPIEKFASTPKVGGTKKLKIDEIRALKPDLIIGNKEENTREDIEQLMHEFPVWMSDIYTLEDALTTITEIGELVNRQPEASYLNYLIKNGFTDLQGLAAQYAISLNTLYLIWRNPYMAAGKHTFIDDILTKIGLINAVKEQRYPELSIDEIKTLAPQMIFLSSEPYPFKQQHIDELAVELPHTKVILVDGEMFSWYGSRLVKSVQYFFDFLQEIKN